MADADKGRLVANIMHFARVLRAAGLPIGPGKVLDAFYWTLHAVFVNRSQHRELFDQAFHVFWRNPRLLERMMALVLPSFRYPEKHPDRELSRRLGEALYRGADVHPPKDPRPPELELDASLTWSAREVLREKDFEQMSAEEIMRAKAAVAAMRLPLELVPTRRYRRHPHGTRIDMRASLRAALVILCDISGSMSRYSRMLLHFAHTLASDRDRVQAFVFGTRLTSITHYLREKDVDTALERIADAVVDWSGGLLRRTWLRETWQTPIKGAW